MVPFKNLITLLLTIWLMQFFCIHAVRPSIACQSRKYFNALTFMSAMDDKLCQAGCHDI